MTATEPEVISVVEHSTRGRPISWIVVVVVILGFLIGGVGLLLGPTWWLFWVGVAMVVVAGVVGWATGIMEDVH